MKILLLSLPLAFLVMAFGAIGADEEKFVIGIKGMTWGFSCAKAVRGTLSRLENVDQVEVDFTKSLATVSMKKGSLTREKVADAFEGSRYSVTNFKPMVIAKKKYTFNVSGMTWAGSCAKRVRETLSKLEGVDQVTVDFSKKTAAVSMKSGSALKQDAVAAALKKNGGFGITAFTEVKPAPRKPQVVTVGLSGMTWGGCANSVRETLIRLEGVDKVTVDKKTNTATITCKAKATVSKDAVTKAFDGSKFKVTSFEAK